MAETEWGDRIPGSPDALFRWLLAQPLQTLIELLADCTARNVEMADWWLSSAGCYLNSVSKAKALEAVKEATGNDPAPATAGMKKAEVVAYCASKLEGTRWLPTPLLRTASGAEGETPTQKRPEAVD